jgi:hypothetical protein
MSPLPFMETRGRSGRLQHNRKPDQTENMCGNDGRLTIKWEVALPT